MTAKFFLQITVIVFTVAWLLLHLFAYYKGRLIVGYIKNKYPDKWKKLGKPQPKYAVPNQVWSLFLSDEVYKEFEDGQLTNMCEKQRFLVRIVLTTAILFFALFGGMAVYDLLFDLNI